MAEKMTDNKPQDQLKIVKRNMLVSVKAGCLTFLVAGFSLVLGLWLDYRMDTLPRWTLILLVGTAPLTLIGVYLIVRRAISKSRDESVHEDETEDVGEAGEVEESNKD